VNDIQHLYDFNHSVKGVNIGAKLVKTFEKPNFIFTAKICAALTAPLAWEVRRIKA
jgi:hypothetical protein